MVPKRTSTLMAVCGSLMPATTRGPRPILTGGSADSLIAQHSRVLDGLFTAIHGRLTTAIGAMRDDGGNAFVVAPS